jgi:pimeloyl-ACP methyl ester carboxylesterase
MENDSGSLGPLHTVRSLDGTPIAYARTGSGPPLLLVHGAGTDHAASWRHALPALATRFTVHAMDRRGRGSSGDAPAYALAREAEDVIAVLDAIGPSVDVLGHSFGGLCALEAALETPRVRRLVLYESIPLRGSDGYRPGLVDELAATLARGDVEGMLVGMMSEVVGRLEAEIDLLRADRSAWAARCSYAPTMVRELRVDEGYVFEPQRFHALDVPALLLVGGQSPEREHTNAAGVAEALPDARVVTVPDAQHIAMITAPERFVAAVVAFLLS